MQRLTKRSGKGHLAAAAAAAIGLAGVGATPAGAGLIVDVRATHVNGVAIAGGPTKEVLIGALGDTVTLALFARVSGTNGVNDETVQAVHGNLVSNSGSGNLLGNLTGGVVAPFNGSGFQNGSNVDLDEDTDLDVGALLGSAGTAALGYILARSNAPMPTTPVDANNGEVQIGQFTFTVSTGDGTFVNWVRRSTSLGNNQLTAATWFEDGSPPSRNPTNTFYGSGTPVLIGAIPEPGTAALAGVAALGLLARRKREVTR